MIAKRKSGKAGIVKANNKPKAWRLSLFGAAESAVVTSKFKGTFEDALAELDVQECEVDFDVIGAVAVVVKSKKGGRK